MDDERRTLIDEAMAERAHGMNSFSQYRKGSASEDYNEKVAYAREVAAKTKERVDPIHHARIDQLLGVYEYKLAHVMNLIYSINARVPSVMIAGPANFPVKKKEKQNAAREKAYEEYENVAGILQKIQSVGRGGISSDHPEALELLKKKLESLENYHALMKAINVHWRAHQTLDGFPNLTEAAKTEILEGMHRLAYKQPFPSYALKNNSGNMKAAKRRIEELEKRLADPTPQGWEFIGGHITIDMDDNRLRVHFKDIPGAGMKDSLKRNGFRWSPRAMAWQRQYTPNAMYAARRLFPRKDSEES